MSRILDDFQLYKNGKDFNNKIEGSFYYDIAKNERYYGGNQWKNVITNGLPTATLNMIKRVVDFSIATVLTNDIAINITSEELNNRENADKVAEVLTKLVNKVLESNHSESFYRESLFDSAISGDGVAHLFFDGGYETGQLMKGIISMENIDNTNIFLGNPNEPIINKLGKPYQPYILITYRDIVRKVQKEAKENNIKGYKLIQGDTDIEHQSGDASKQEMNQVDKLDMKCTVILKMWEKDGKIWARKSTKFAEVRKEWETKSTIYPVALMNWTKRKNCYHGRSVCTGVLPNQLIVNKLLAMGAYADMYNAFPTTFYDKQAVSGFSNKIGKSVGVDTNGQPLSSLVYRFNGVASSSNITPLIELIISRTMEMMGVSDTALGLSNPENTSALVVNIKQAGVPLQNVQANLYKYIEDIVHIIIDMMAGYYGERLETAETVSDDALYNIDFSQVRQMLLSVKVDVGPSSYWGEMASKEELAMLLERDKITFLQYLERVPSGTINKKEELIKEIEAQMKQEAQMPQGEMPNQPML